MPDENSVRSPTKDWTIYNVLLMPQEAIELFVSDYHNRSSCEPEIVREMLKDPSTVHLCYIHLNHSRYAQKMASSSLSTGLHGIASICVFHDHGCSRREKSSNSRFWRVPHIDVCSANTLEEFSQLEETVSSHSDGSLHAREVMGKLCCRSCLYLVMEGKNLDRPAISISTLTSVVDRCLVRCILFALDPPKESAAQIPFKCELPNTISAIAQELRDSCICPQFGSGDGLRMLPFQKAVRVRAILCDSNVNGDIFAIRIDPRTIQKRLEGVLTSKGVVLKKLGYRLRCCMAVDQVEKLLSRLSNTNVCTLPRPPIDEIHGHLHAVADLFRERKLEFWKGQWSLTEIISLIPRQLWIDYVLLMASGNRLRIWKAASRATGMRLEDTFPMSNIKETLPSPSIEEELRNGGSYSRADLLICVRVLKAIENTVLSRTDGVAGPLTIAVSVSGICEVSPSFVSVLNAMGLFLSYQVTERFREKLIAERERTGPWDFNKIDEASIPVLQFDNWDIKPVHAVKTDGKAMPKVNGSLLQGHLPGTCKGDRQAVSDNFDTRPKKIARIDSWKSVACLGTREQFVKRFTTPENAAIINQFNNVVFGLVALFRGQLVGGKEAKNGEYNAATRKEFGVGVENGHPVNFRTLLISAFKPYGGADATDETRADQHVVYVEISRESAADILTVRRFLNMVEEQLRPGSRGRPRYIVLGGDQPSYKMFVELWLQSWRGGTRSASTAKLLLHEWMVPFPGLFHAEKQAMYSLCKEMLDGLGLEELAGCAGLSDAHVANIITHSHARNNRAVLFNRACAMIIHLIENLLLGDATMSEAVRRLHAAQDSKRLTADDMNVGKNVHLMHRPGRNSREDLPFGSLYEQTSTSVSGDVIRVGEMLRNRISRRFSDGANGKHFVQTVLFSSLLPTLGFHVLSRTGHTDFTDAFWFRQNSVLHSSTHLKYQELSLFYLFFRSIIPSFVERDLFTTKPGRAVTRLLSFTALGSQGSDGRGNAYVHCDEALEMLIVRHLKSLSVNFLAHLENSASWLMEVSMFRALIRFMTGASRALHRTRQDNDAGEIAAVSRQYDRNACQWRTVSRMVHVMREAGFLSVAHRGSEWLTNVFSNPPRRMTVLKDQDSLLSVSTKGEITAQPHASVLFPEVFGPLSDEDRKIHFNDKKFKKWTKCRAVIRPGHSMRKEGGSVVEDGDGEGHSAGVVIEDLSLSRKRPRSKNEFTKIVQDRRRRITKMKDAFYEEQSTAVKAGNMNYLREVMARRDALHGSRYLISPFADCFLDHEGKLNHGAKSRFLKYAVRDNRDIIYPMNTIRGSVVGGKG
ncbi:hypothetical protein BWQ96_05589 [Gracilariopsis chorda]|uniref:Uncharacterized protein n=1 Tax=Gracilariopsis chorda TaxID=448386 RepID=A0A2V3ISC4_9FLOR|nr:hypothetical protein BWQ96_05589 [Gracilariopsis chorda]|eukprot:PXF44647.1 hypothetical protein BWQ96_05589 [Gracilariopsis chorda]